MDWWVSRPCRLRLGYSTLPSSPKPLEEDSSNRVCFERSGCPLGLKRRPTTEPWVKGISTTRTEWGHSPRDSEGITLPLGPQVGTDGSHTIPTDHGNPSVLRGMKPLSFLLLPPSSSLTYMGLGRRFYSSGRFRGFKVLTVGDTREGGLRG